MEQKQIEFQYVVCITNDGYDVSLEPRKIYRAIPDDTAASHQMIRVVDESGEDYLYPADFFAPISLPEKLVESLAFVEYES
jgi:hypothetical protein